MAPMTDTAATAPTVAVWEARSNAARKAIRTVLQVIVALGGPVALLLTGVLDPAQAASFALLLTPVVTFAQNLLEDKGIIGTWLRRPTPAGTASVVLTVDAVPGTELSATVLPIDP